MKNNTKSVYIAGSSILKARANNTTKEVYGEFIRDARNAIIDAYSDRTHYDNVSVNLMMGGGYSMMYSFEGNPENVDEQHLKFISILSNLDTTLNITLSMLNISSYED